MTIGVRAHDFGRQDPVGLSKSVKNGGFDGCQLALTKAIYGVEQFTDVNDRLLDEVRAAFDKNQVEISVLGCYVELSLPDREERLRHVDNFLLGLGHARKLGVAIAATETTHLDPFAPDNVRERIYRDLKDSILRMVERAEKENVVIGVETVADHTLNSARLTRRLLDEVGSDKLKVVFDPVNLILEHTKDQQAAIYRDFYDTVGEDIAAVHIKDIVFEGGQKVWRNIGKGIVDFQAIIPWLLEHKPHVPLLREMVRPDSAGEDAATLRRLAKVI